MGCGCDHAKFSDGDRATHYGEPQGQHHQRQDCGHDDSNTSDQDSYHLRAVDVTIPKSMAATTIPMLGDHKDTINLDNSISNSSDTCFFWIKSKGRGRDHANTNARDGEHSDSCSEDKVIISCVAHSILICLA
jgi:hypothetical protein